MTHRERAQLFMDNCGTGNRLVSVDVLTVLLDNVRAEALEEAAAECERSADAQGWESRGVIDVIRAMKGNQ